MEDLTRLLKRFLALDDTKNEWAVADILHIMSRLTARNAEDLSILIDNGLMNHLHWLLIKQAEDNFGWSDVTLLGEDEFVMNNNNTQILERSGKVELIDFLFPLLLQIANSHPPLCNGLFQFKPGVGFLHMMRHPKFRCRMVELYKCWLLSGDGQVKEFLCNEATIEVMTQELMRAGPSSSKILSLLNTMFSHVKEFSQAWADNSGFWKELVSMLSDSPRARALGNNINEVRRHALHAVHALMCSVANPDTFAKAHFLKETLTPLAHSTNSNDKIVKKMAKALLEHYYTESEHEALMSPSQTILSRRERKKAAKRCSICQKDFRFPGPRKHYCKQCGFVVCGKCSPFKTIVEAVDKTVPKRICRNCNELRGEDIELEARSF